MSSIFISHNSSDNVFAQQIVDYLKKAGHQSFFLDFDPGNGIPPGRNWEKELYANLRKCYVVIVIYSSRYASSLWCFAEITHARALGKYIITIKIEDCSVNTILADAQIIDAINGFNERVAERLEKGLVASGATKEDWDINRSPYPGLLAFEEADSPVFFGRQDETENLLKLLRQFKNFGGARLLMVLGASGSGKSSLIKGGLIPHLRKNKKSWIIIGPFRPLKNLFEELSKAIASAFSDFNEDRPWQVIYDLIIKDEKSTNLRDSALSGMLRELTVLAADPNVIVLIFIDQFEELLFNKNEGKGSSFLSYLSCFLKTAEVKYLIIGSLRSDFLGNFQQAQSFKGIIFDDYIVQSVTRDSLRASIVGPATVAGIELGEGLAEEILQDTGTPDALPLLAFTLRELWEQYGKDRKLELTEYRALGGIGGSIARAAEAVLLAYVAETGKEETVKTTIEAKKAAGMRLEDERQLKAAFREMVRIDEEGRYTKRPVNWDALPLQINDLLLKLVAARLLVRYGDGKDIKVEVAHEALFRTWNRLVKWLEEDKSFLTWRKRLNLDLEEWQRTQANESTLLRGPALQEAVEWLSQVKSAKYHLTSAEIEFIEASHEESKKQRLKKRKSRTFLLAGIGLALIIISILYYNANKNYVETRNQLAGNYWNRARSARAENKLSEALHFMAEGVIISKDVSLTENMLLDIETFLPQCLLKNIIKHRGGVHSAVFSPDGNRILTSDDDSTARIWDAASGKQIGPKMKHAGDVTNAVFSPDGRRVLTASDDYTARLWDVATGKQIGLEMKHESYVNCAVFSPDGKRVLTASSDQTARLWDAASGKQIGPEMKHDDVVMSAVFSPDGERVLTASDDGTARIWDGASGKQIGPEMKHREGVTSAVFSPDGKQVLTASFDGSARLWDAGSGKQIGPEMKHEGSVHSAVFSADGSRILTAAQDHTARIWDVVSGEEIGHGMEHRNVVTSAVFSPDGKRVLTTSEDNAARLWDAVSGKQIGPEMKHEGFMSSAVFSPDGKHILTASFDSTARIWDVVSIKQIDAVMKHEDFVNSAVFSPDLKHILTASLDSTARLWDAESGKQIGPAMRHKGAVNSGIFSADGKRVLTASDDRTARLWDAESGKQIGPEMRHDGGVYSAVFSPDGEQVLTATRDHTAGLWNAESSKQIGPELKHKGLVASAVFSRDGKRILTASLDSTARLWDAESGKQIGPAMWHKGAVNSAVFSADGKWVLTASKDQTARLWDAGSGKQIGLEMRHKSAIVSAVFSPDGKWVLTASYDQTARLWDVVSGKQIGPEMRHRDAIHSAVFSPDGKRILTASLDSTVRLWDAGSGKQIGPEMKHESIVFSAVFSADGKRILTVDGDSTARLLDTGSDLDIPAALFKLQAIVTTGFKLNTETGEIQPISSGQWYKLKEEYENKAREHYKTCKYRQYNLWSHFYPEEIRKSK